MHTKAEIQLNERAQKLLKALVECYIKEGHPVGSKTLSETSELSMSPATIRNIMADLETEGLLCSPHTSAGRIPTSMGYRLFVDSLLNIQPITELDIDNTKKQLQNCTDTKALAEEASEILSGITKLASLVMLPLKNLSTLRQVEFLPLSGNRVLAILVLNTHEVQNRIIYTDKLYTAAELQQISNFLTANFAGKNLIEIKQKLIAAMQKDRVHIENLTQAIIDMANKTFDESSQNDYVISGETNLIEKTQQSDLDKLRNLFEAFAQKRNILHLLDNCLSAEEVKIYIGEESGYEVLWDYSLITKPYRKAGKIVGVLGVIGPTRMSYDRAIAAVDITAELLSSVLEENEGER